MTYEVRGGRPEPARLWLVHAWSGSRVLDTVVTALGLAASGPSVSAPSDDRTDPSPMRGVHARGEKRDALSGMARVQLSPQHGCCSLRAVAPMWSGSTPINRALIRLAGMLLIEQNDERASAGVPTVSVRAHANYFTFAEQPCELKNAGGRSAPRSGCRWICTIERPGREARRVFSRHEPCVMRMRSAGIVAPP